MKNGKTPVFNERAWGIQIILEINRLVSETIASLKLLYNQVLGGSSQAVGSHGRWFSCSVILFC